LWLRIMQFFYLLCPQFRHKASSWINKTLLLVKQQKWLSEFCVNFLIKVVTCYMYWFWGLLQVYLIQPLYVLLDKGCDLLHVWFWGLHQVYLIQLLYVLLDKDCDLLLYLRNRNSQICLKNPDRIFRKEFKEKALSKSSLKWKF
jgi:hypothetical protein